MRMFFSRRHLQSTLFRFLFLTLILATPTSQSYSQSDFNQTFRSGDAVRVIVWQEPGASRADVEKLEIAGDYVIDYKGNIFLPLIGDVQVAGHSQESLSSTLKEKYKPFTSGLHFVCKPLIRVTIMGMVQRPGMQLVEGTANLWELIDLAEGPERGADLEKIFVMRGGQIVAENLLEKFENAYSLKEIGIQSGDQVVLEQRKSFSFRSILEYSSFFFSAASLYLQIQRNN